MKTHTITAVGFLLVATLSISAFPFAVLASIFPERLRIEYLDNPQGLDIGAPRFSWILEAVDSTAFGKKQTAYRLLVASNQRLLDKGEADLWDSDWVETDETQHIRYQGDPFLSDRTYYWKVQVKDESGNPSPWSNTASWTTGIFDQEEWKAQWIGGDEVFDPAEFDSNIWDPWLRKSVSLREKPFKATMFVASIGYHELYVNGHLVGDEVLSPAVTDHTKRARYVAYDVAKYLEKGDNVIGIWLGTSWSIFPGYQVDASRPLTPMVTAQMTIYDSEASVRSASPTTTLVTDSSWSIKPSPNKLLGIWDFRQMGGELWDDRKAESDWNLPTYDDSDWKMATVYQPELKLSAQRLPGNKLLDEIHPIAIEERPDGSYRIDMGVNFAGWTEVRLRGQEGDRIDFEYSERADDDMTFNLRSAYIIGERGEGVFKNRFNYSSGRWITIRGLREKPKLSDIKGWLVRTDFRSTTMFRSSDPLQNWIHDRICWTFENLALGGFIVDCPQRERMGYGGDAHATSETGIFNYELDAFYTKWMEDWRDVQGTEPMVGNMHDPDHARKAETSGRIFNNGVLPHTAPTYWGGGGPAWGGIVVTLPWFMYQHYGDKQVLEENFELMRGWLAFLDTHTEDNLLRRFGGQWDFLGDWLWPGATAEGMNNDTPENLCFNNSYYVFNLRTASKVAKVIGRHREAKKWAERADQGADAINLRFYNPDDHSYADGSMANLAAALLAEIPSAEIRSHVISRLEKEILVERNGHIHAGITGGAMLFKLLRDEGRDDLIYSMVSKDTYPGWGYMKDNGATTIWEMWEKDLPGHSLLHSSYLYPAAWHIDGLSGIQRHPDKPGFKQFIVRPPATGDTDISWVQSSYDSPVGLIQSNWKKQESNNVLELKIVVPVNSAAVLQIGQTHRLQETHPHIKDLGIIDGYRNYTLVSGSYTLKAIANP